MANLTAQEKDALDKIEASMARKGFALGSIIEKISAQNLEGAASAGGAASETVAVVGLKSTDTVIAVSQRVAGAVGLALLGWTRTGAEDDLQIDYALDPGAGAIVSVLFKRG